MDDDPPMISLAETAGMMCVGGVEGRGAEEIVGFADSPATSSG